MTCLATGVPSRESCIRAAESLSSHTSHQVADERTSPTTTAARIMKGFRESLQNAYQQASTFRGRATRAEFWWFYLYFAAIGAALLTTASVTRSAFGWALGIVGLLFLLANISPLLSLVVRRLHDTNRSGSWAFIYFVPILGLAIMTVILALPSWAGETAFDLDLTGKA